MQSSLPPMLDNHSFGDTDQMKHQTIGHGLHPRYLMPLMDLDCQPIAHLISILHIDEKVCEQEKAQAPPSVA